jgi:hypothetical protein
VPTGKSTLYDDTVQLLAQRGRVAPPPALPRSLPGCRCDWPLSYRERSKGQGGRGGEGSLDLCLQ